MEWKLLTKEDYVTTTWSGGTTTQLAIAPEGAVYADRDFLWRLSSAGVELGAHWLDCADRRVKSRICRGISVI